MRIALSNDMFHRRLPASSPSPLFQYVSGFALLPIEVAVALAINGFLSDGPAREVVFKIHDQAQVRYRTVLAVLADEPGTIQAQAQSPVPHTTQAAVRPKADANVAQNQGDNDRLPGQENNEGRGQMSWPKRTD